MRGLIVASGALILLLIISLPQALETEKEVRKGTDQEFEQLSLELSEEPGYFDTDNLISNELSYLQVLPRLKEITETGQVYLGVGPDQNFTYIAQVKPTMAIILDVRRDNLLQHLYFKQLIEASDNRWQYLSLLFGKQLPENFRPEFSADIPVLVEHFWDLPSDQEFFEQTFLEVWSDIRRRFPHLTQEEDRATFYAIAVSFFKESFQLRFRSHGRLPRPQYPTYEQLVRARDQTGEMRHYLNSESDFQFLKTMQEENRILPVIGDFAGPTALKSIGDYLKRQGLVVSTFYVSNVEFYLFGSRGFSLFLENLKGLPVDQDSVIIRSYFNYRQRHPETVSGSYVTTLLQKIESFLSLHQQRPYRDYWDVVTRDYISTEVAAQ